MPFILGTSGNDTLIGSDGDDTILGDQSDDILDGGPGNDALEGGDGDDVLISGPGSGRLDGGQGIDTADYSSAPTWVTVTLLTNQALQGVAQGSGDFYTNEIFGVENVIGGAFADSLTGDWGSNRLDGGAGSDALAGWWGDDLLIGGAGNDHLTGDVGVDVLSGGAGNDTFLDSASGLSGDTITDFGIGDCIRITDADINGFSFSLSGNMLNYTGGSVTLQVPVTGTIIVTTASGGGVQLAINDARNDFNGDGRSDILWRSENGQITNWLGQSGGGFADNSAHASEHVPVSWQVAAIADLNGDGREDVLWRNSAGQITNWLGQADGGYLDNAANGYAVVAPSWQVAGTGDFNGDGRSDILWHNDNGALTDWLGTSTGGYTDNSVNASVTVGTSWQIAGTGDFNGDGRDDILWRNSDGSLTNWLGQPNGKLVNNANASTSVAISWHIVGTGDFNGDGRDDILWRNDNGDLTNWLGQTNGSFANNPSASTWIPIVWHVVSVGDYNGDGRDDILWRNDNGDFTNWLGQASGGFVNNPDASTWVPTNWAVTPDQLI